MKIHMVNSRSLPRVIVAIFALLSISCVSVPATVAHNPKLKSVQFEGYLFHYQRFGSPDKPLVLAIHGGPGGDSHYLRNLKLLTDEFQVLLYDQRGTGLSARESPEETKKHSLESSLRDLNFFVDHFGGSKPVRLVGHSWGGMLATAYISRYGQKVSHTLIMEPGILGPETARLFAKMAAKEVSPGIGTLLGGIFVVPFIKTRDGHERMDYMMTRVLNSGGGPPYECPNSDLPPNAFTRAGYQTMQMILGPVMEDPSRFTYHLANGINKYSGKIMLLSSSCSFIGYDYQEKYHRELFPARTDHIRLEGTGHDMITLNPEKSLPVIREFLGR